MKKTYKTILAAIAWGVIAAVVSTIFISGCSQFQKSIDEDVLDEGFLLNDDLIAIRSDDGTISIKNTTTGVITIRDIKLDWTQPSRNDSLAVFCADGKRGYYNMYTGEIAIPAQYRRAWIFSEGLAAAQKNGNIGFIDRMGNVVIDFKYPYHGNPLSCFVFEDGHCVVADTTGHCGVIDKSGTWLIRPDYDYVAIFKEYAIATKAGVTLQVDFEGNVINSFVLDDIKELTYSQEERVVDRDGNVSYAERTVYTGYYSYTIGGRCGLMNSDCQCLTEPLYRCIRAVNSNMFRATLLDYSSEVLLNKEGNVIN